MPLHASEDARAAGSRRVRIAEGYVAFLPVAYGKLALNDAPTLAPVCLSLWGTVGILRDGRRRDYAIAWVSLSAPTDL